MTTGPTTSHSDSSAHPPRRRLTQHPLLLTAGIVIALIIGFIVATQIYTDVLWYDQLGYLGVFVRENLIRLISFTVAAVVMASAVWVSLFIAYRGRPAEHPTPRAAQERESRTGGQDPMADLQAIFSQNMRRYQESIEPMRRALMVLVPLLIGLFTASTIAAQWDTLVLFLNRESFGMEDPEFGLDLSFYVFTLPFLRLVLGFLMTTVIFSGLAGLLMHYLYGGLQVSEKGVKTTRTFKVHLGVTAALLLLIQAVNFWLARYGTLQSESGSWAGALYTDVNAVIPTNGILAVTAALVALTFIFSVLAGRWRIPMIGTAMLLVVALVAGGLYPWIVQRFQVTPTEQTMEKPYIQRNIDMTRQAYGLADIQTQDYEATVETGQGALEQDSASISNIRLLDPDVVSAAFAQLQQFRPYYQFRDTLAVDRYSIDGKTRDTVIAARELNPQQNADQGWYNQRIVYTHGYGVVAAYGNQVTADGKPKFMQSGITAQGEISQDYEPRIYFGRSSPEYSIVGGSVGDQHLELDRPQTADDNESNDAMTTFTGDGGPNVGNWFNRLAYSIKYQSTDLLLSDAVRPESQILYDRDPAERVDKVAPFLTVDGDPYPAIINGRVKWIVDAYTTSQHYPYSTSTQLGEATSDSQTQGGMTQALPNREVNYIRNSVKATVDAYDGTVDLYAWEDDDPVLKAWTKVFPGAVKPLSEMSAELMEHVRYPEDLFKVQRKLLNKYHVTDANSFYAGDDVWEIPNDPTAERKDVALPPYYLSLKMPKEQDASFSLTTPFIPQQSDSNTRNVMYGFLSANGDAGTGKDGVKSKEYGTLKLLELPRSSVVPGPGQAQNLFNSDTSVSTELNLLRQGASEVISGNLLTLPVGGGILYVQPVYVQSSGDASYPTLRRVLVGFGEKVGFAPTLEEALDQVFEGNSGAQVAENAGVDAAEADTKSGSGAGGESSDASGRATLDSALQEAHQAMKDADQAMKEGDWTAYGKAQDRLEKALQRALEADGAAPQSAEPAEQNSGK